MIIRTLLLLFSCCYGAYSDPELENLWFSISDIYNPSYEDYQKVERYLKTGTRPYLDLLRKPHKNSDRLPSILNLKLVGENNQMPIFERHSINTTEKTSKRCILLFGSFNGLYPQKVRRALNDLNKCGYSGDVLIRIGGFPNLNFGGLKLCHVPYAFKVAFLYEAYLLGYSHILWLDTSMNPLTNLEMIFSELETKGYFFTYVGSLHDNRPSNLDEAGEALNITPELFHYIHHIASGIVGINTNFESSLAFLKDWYQETENVFPNITWFPEEMSLAVTAWRQDLIPQFWFGQIVCTMNEKPTPERPLLQFFIDTSR